MFCLSRIPDHLFPVICIRPTISVHHSRQCYTPAFVPSLVTLSGRLQELDDVLRRLQRIGHITPLLQADVTISGLHGDDLLRFETVDGFGNFIEDEIQR
jgi:hypothetical protein